MHGAGLLRRTFALDICVSTVRRQAQPSIHYAEWEIEGERLELTDPKARYWLGPDLTLRRCTLVLGVGARSLCLASSRLIDCTVQLLATRLGRHPGDLGR